jgi:hypothetical protein
VDIVIDAGKFGKRWHIGEAFPELGKEVWVLVDKDTKYKTEPELYKATVQYMPNGNPPYIWNLQTGSDSDSQEIDFWSIAGGSSVYAWRYVDE